MSETHALKRAMRAALDRSLNVRYAPPDRSFDQLVFAGVQSIPAFRCSAANHLATHGSALVSRWSTATLKSLIRLTKASPTDKSTSCNDRSLSVSRSVRKSACVISSLSYEWRLREQRRG